MLYENFNLWLSKQKAQKAPGVLTVSQKPPTKKISTSPSGNRLKEDFGLSKKEINIALDELENIYSIDISGVDREEIITTEDLITAVYLQLNKDLVEE